MSPVDTASGLLPALLLVPLIGALLLAFIPKDQDNIHRGTGFTISLITFALSLPLLAGFDTTLGHFQSQFDFSFPWIEGIGASFTLQVDGISLWIILLTTFLTPILLFAAKDQIHVRTREFVIAMLVLESAMLGALMATDLLLFYLFWELMLLPVYLMVGIWGGAKRHYATLKFVVYTVVGSLFMLVGIIWLSIAAGSFAYSDILSLTLSGTEQTWLFLAFAAAFLIKVPLFPLHTWLPETYAQAPTSGSVILSGVLAKMGTYGLLRFAMVLFPEAMGTFSPYILVGAVVGILYGALVAYSQGELKKLIAYSSISHLGFVVLGLVSFQQQSIEGALLQMVNHGISTAALFLLIGMLQDRTGDRDIAAYGGVASKMPILTTLFIVVTMSAIGLPGTNGFAGEFLILSGAFLEGPLANSGNSWLTLSFVMAVLATFGVLLGAIYMLSMVRRVFFGPLTNPAHAQLKDLSLREVLTMLPLIAFIFVIGLTPASFTKFMAPTVSTLVEQVNPRLDGARMKSVQAEATPSTEE